MNPVILIVDDYDSVRVSLRFFLEANGYDVRDASGLAGALAIAQQETLHAAIVDVHLEGMTGYRVCKALKALNAALPVWLMTASPGDDIRRAAAAEGALGVFAKPFDQPALLATLARLVPTAATSEPAQVG